MYTFNDESGDSRVNNWIEVNWVWASKKALKSWSNNKNVIKIFGREKHAVFFIIEKVFFCQGVVINSENNALSDKSFWRDEFKPYLQSSFYSKTSQFSFKFQPLHHFSCQFHTKTWSTHIFKSHQISCFNQLHYQFTPQIARNTVQIKL